MKNKVSQKPDLDLSIHLVIIVQAGKTKGGSITVPLTSCLTGLDQCVLQIKTKIVSCHAAASKPVKQEVNGIVILPPLVFPGTGITYHRHLRLSKYFYKTRHIMSQQKHFVVTLAFRGIHLQLDVFANSGNKLMHLFVLVSVVKITCLLCREFFFNKNKTLSSVFWLFSLSRHQ